MVVSEYSCFDIIASIYEAALDPELWADVLRRIAELAGGVSTGIFVFEPRTGRLVHDLASEFPQRDAYLAHYVHMDPRNAFGVTQPAGTKLTDYAFITEAEIAHSEFYQDYLIPNGMGYVGAKLLKNDPRGIAGVAIQRPRDRGPFELDGLELLDRLGPHLLRALEVQSRLAEAELQRAADLAVLDQLPFGVVLLTDRRQVLLLNECARALVAASDGITVVRDELRANRLQDSERLRQLIKDAITSARGQGGESGGRLLLPRPSLRRPLGVLVAPVPMARRLLSLDAGARRPAAVVIISDPETGPEPSERALRRLYGFTNAEAALASALVRGSSVKGHAERMRISTETARWHLKNVFVKTETNRQADLVRLILKAAPARPA